MPGADADLLAEILNLFLVQAEECLIDAGRDAPANVFHSHGPTRPPGDKCGDYLSVFTQNIFVSGYDANGNFTFPSVVGQPMSNCGGAQMGVNAALALCRPCFPGLINDPTDPFPTAAAMQEAADNLAIDARVLWCCMIAAQTQNLLVPDGYPFFDDGLSIVWRQMTPFRGGGVAGWQWDFTILLPGCCWTAPSVVGS